jgi:hypothetical protein
MNNKSDIKKISQAKMKIINSIKFLLLIVGGGNLNLSFAQADFLD